MTRTKRSLSLIAKFIDGYADGWFFAVGEYFRDQLDIRFTERIEPVLVDGQIQYEWVEKNGKTRKKKLTKKVLRWTQGNAYCFAQGHVLYDSKQAKKLVWHEAMEQISIGCQVTSSTPDSIDDHGHFIHGSVHFDLLKPDGDKKTLMPAGQYHLSQHDFVTFLKTGNDMNVIIKAKSSSGDPYDVTFTRQNNLLTVFCTCPAGKWGKICKHKRAFLEGDTSFLYNSAEASDLISVVNLVKKTDWPILDKEHDQIKREIEILDHKEKSSRAKIERLLNEGLRIS